MLRVITLNVNGLRAALKKDFLSWLVRQRADIVCLQEIRLGREGLPEALSQLPWYAYYFPAVKLGYSGTALLSRYQPDAVTYGFGTEEFDDEGRYCALDIGRLTVASVYAPSGSSGPHRQASKDRFLKVFQEQCARLVAEREDCLLCGDFNIAHTKKDLKNWSSNQKNSGFLPHERQWMDRWLGVGDDPQQSDWRDVFRCLNHRSDQYTWWSNRGRAWENNVGWRIDYQMATQTLADTATREKIYKDRRYSDHSPLIIDYDYDLAVERADLKRRSHRATVYQPQR